jgi:hypothetical protein
MGDSGLSTGAGIAPELRGDPKRPAFAQPVLQPMQGGASARRCIRVLAVVKQPSLWLSDSFASGGQMRWEN